MKFAIIAGLVILIVAFVAVVVLLLRNKNQNSTENEDFDDNYSPSLDSNSHIARDHQVPQNNGMNAQQQPQNRKTLEIAQGYIQQQRYDEAENELRTGIRVQPKNNTFYLKLLNLYAITNNHQEFQNIFSKIISNGDIDVIKQAEQLKLMVDAEQSNIQSSETKPEVNNEFVPDKGIDFNLDEDESKNPLNTPVDTIDEPFGNLEDSFLEDNNSNSSENNNDGLNFELSMDNAEISSPSSSPEQTPDIDLSLDSDLLSANSNTTQEVLADDTFNSNDNDSDLQLDDFGFDFNLNEEPVTDSQLNEQPLDELTIGNPEVSESTLEMSLSSDDALDNIVSPTASEGGSLEISPNVNDELDGLDDFSFDTPSLNSSNSEEPVVDSMNDFSTMDIGLDNLIDDSPTVAATSLEVPVEVDDLSDFNFDLPNEANEASPISAEVDSTIDNDTSDIFDSLGELDSGLSQIDGLDIDNFSVDSHNINAEPEAFIENSILDAPVVETQEPVAKIVDEFDNTVNQNNAPTRSDVEYSDDFTLLKSLDNNQITLDLASQYLDLGEYDSAKRLLSEVMKVGTAEQQQKAQNLLDTAS